MDCLATNMVLILTETWQFFGNFSPSFETHYLICVCVLLPRVGDLIWSICFLRPKGKHCSDTLARVNWIITSSQASQMRITVLFAGIMQEFLKKTTSLSTIALIVTIEIVIMNLWSRWPCLPPFTQLLMQQNRDSAQGKNNISQREKF